MIERAQLERRCTKFASTLELYESDDVALLRTARRLKHVHADLLEMLDAGTVRRGWTPQLTEARVGLLDIEHRLRRVLLDYQALDRQSVKNDLMAAVNKSLKVLELLK
jgi:hypothetical protein